MARGGWGSLLLGAGRGMGDQLAEAMGTQSKRGREGGPLGTFR